MANMQFVDGRMATYLRRCGTKISPPGPVTSFDRSPGEWARTRRKDALQEGPGTDDNEEPQLQSWLHGCALLHSVAE